MYCFLFLKWRNTSLCTHFCIKNGYKTLMLIKREVCLLKGWGECFRWGTWSFQAETEARSLFLNQLPHLHSLVQGAVYLDNVSFGHIRWPCCLNLPSTSDAISPFFCQHQHFQLSSFWSICITYILGWKEWFSPPWRTIVLFIFYDS